MLHSKAKTIKKCHLVLINVYALTLMKKVVAEACCHERHASGDQWRAESDISTVSGRYVQENYTCQWLLTVEPHYTASSTYQASSLKKKIVYSGRFTKSVSKLKRCFIVLKTFWNFHLRDLWSWFCVIHWLILIVMNL